MAGWGARDAEGKHLTTVILLLAVLAGLSVGLVRAWLAGERYQPGPLRHIWLVIAAFLPQILAFYLPVTRVIFPDWLAEACLVSSLVGLMAFTWINRKHRELWVVGGGLTANLLVIVANGGLMPITQAFVAALYPGVTLDAELVGSRLGWSKNIVLPGVGTHFAYLSDCILLPAWVPWRYAFSLGDVLIAIGAFWLLWSGSNTQPMALKDRA